MLNMDGRPLCCFWEGLTTLLLNLLAFCVFRCVRLLLCRCSYKQSTIRSLFAANACVCALLFCLFVFAVAQAGDRGVTAECTFCRSKHQQQLRYLTGSKT